MYYQFINSIIQLLLIMSTPSATAYGVPSLTSAFGYGSLQTPLDTVFDVKLLQKMVSKLRRTKKNKDRLFNRMQKLEDLCKQKKNILLNINDINAVKKYCRIIDQINALKKKLPSKIWDPCIEFEDDQW